MDPRKEQLFCLLVEDVIDRGEPVGSQSMVADHELDVSAATVRNWFAEFEDHGLITHPHTSSGRVPTEKGYRLYVDHLMEERAMPKRERTELEDLLTSSGTDRVRRAKLFAKLVAEKCATALVLGTGDADTYYTGLTGLFSQPEFHDANQMMSLGSILDHLDEILIRVRTQKFSVPTILIGTECPFGSMCASILLTLSSGELIAAVGPQRMPYARLNSYFLTLNELV